jgi:hypothetical protein
MMENLVEWRLAGETEVLGENLPSATLSTTNPTWPDPGLNPGRRGGKPATNRLSYGTRPYTEKNKRQSFWNLRNQDILEPFLEDSNLSS